MREIKFRAYLHLYQVMIYNDDISLTEGYVYERKLIDGVMHSFKRKDSALMQYTGLKDKNGVEIYEGDIVSIAGEEFNYEVEWIEHEEHGYPIGWGLFPNTFEYEVIGNIYENNELLGDSK